MAPALSPETYVFTTVKGDQPASQVPHIMRFEEAEGTTYILKHEDAERAGMNTVYRCRMITLTIHSALDAIGFLAAITRELASAGISVNAVSAYYHDHLFVPHDRAEDAMRVLGMMAARAQR